MPNKNSIARNTIALYIRMLLSLIVSLYTARVVLDVLGINDYGIYISVGGIAGFISFINSALGNATTRFITYSLGTKNNFFLEKTFSTALSIHILLALIIIILGETIGLWFLHHKLVIPADRIVAATWVYHISIITVFFTITQVPFTASINAHEHMSIYAFTSILEALLKLFIVFLLNSFNYDKLILYSILYFSVTLFMLLFYRIYCLKYFPETHYHPQLSSKSIFKEISIFSSWSFLNAGGIALNAQGVLLLLNMFFSPAVVSARAISLQINGLAMQFSNNIRAAANPQIIKRYANRNYEDAKQLVLKTSQYSYLLMWFLALPIFFLADPILHLWLKTVPEYTTIFLRFVIIQSLFSTLQASFFTAFYAQGKLKINTLLSSLIYFVQFPIVYICFKFNCSPIILSIICLITDVILALVIQPMLLIRQLNYSKYDLIKVIYNCLKISLLSSIIPILLYQIIDCHSVGGFIVMGLTCTLSNIFIIWKMGIEDNLKLKILRNIKLTINKQH